MEVLQILSVVVVCKRRRLSCNLHLFQTVVRSTSVHWRFRVSGLCSSCWNVTKVRGNELNQTLSSLFKGSCGSSSLRGVEVVSKQGLVGLHGCFRDLGWSLPAPEQSFSRAGHIDWRTPGLRPDVGVSADLLKVLVLAQALCDLLALFLFVGVILGTGFVECWGGGAVHLEPPVTYEVRLAEDGAVGTKERDLAGCVANVEYLESIKKNYSCEDVFEQ